MAEARPTDQLTAIANALRKAVFEMLRERLDVTIVIKTSLERKKIIEFNRRMRVFGMEKFTGPTFVSTVNYYLNEGDMQKDKAIGALLIYIEQDYVADLLPLLKYPAVDRSNDDALKDACGTLANIVAGRFKSEMVAQGFAALVMSPFANYRNSALEGVAFYSKHLDKYEINVYITDIKRFVVEITMGPISQQKAA